jgi:hypothetical protein
VGPIDSLIHLCPAPGINSDLIQSQTRFHSQIIRFYVYQKSK